MATIAGEKYGRLTVLYQLRFTPKRAARAVVQCDCGAVKSVIQSQLRNGRTISCGCARRENFIARTRTHGLTDSTTYGSWRAMIARCTNSNDKSYPLYGGRGVKVCDHWKTFANFLADMGTRPDGKTIDRFPNKDGNYEPGNCRWADAFEQSRNRRSAIVIEHDGRSLTVAEWARELGVRENMLYKRIRIRKLSAEQVLGLAGARFAEAA